MPHLMEGIGRVFSRIGIGALYNKTTVPFLTCDNPVMWFDPSVPEADLKPYVLKPKGPVVLLFPVSPSMLIYGHTCILEQFDSSGLGHGDLVDVDFVEMINRQVCQFGYEAIFAREAGQEQIIRDHSAKSPTVDFERISTSKGEVVTFQMIFGKRERKPKWVEESDNQEAAP